MAVTGGALETMGQMSFVREVHEVRKPLEAAPGYRNLFLPVVQKGGSVHCFRGQVLMATHAQFHGWDPGGRRLFGKAVELEKIDSEAPRMQFMAEAQGLCVGADQVGASLGIE
jgi:hypothetical protein